MEGLERTLAMGTFLNFVIFVFLIECNGPFCQYHKVKKDDPKWLETIVAVDDSVIQACPYV